MFDMTDFGFPDLDNLSIEGEKIDQENLGERENVNKLKFGTRSIILSEEELDQLNRVYDDYVEKNGLDIGFAFYLCEGK